jgi:hypothetical protein
MVGGQQSEVARVQRTHTMSGLSLAGAPWEPSMPQGSSSHAAYFSPAWARHQPGSQGEHQPYPPYQHRPQSWPGEAGSARHMGMHAAGAALLAAARQPQVAAMQHQQPLPRLPPHSAAAAFPPRPRSVDLAPPAFPPPPPAELDPLDPLDPLFLATIIDPGRRKVCLFRRFSLAQQCTPCL